MKKLLTLIVFITIAQAHAIHDMTKIERGDMGLHAADGKIIKVTPLCPTPAPGEVTCMAYGSKVKVKVKLNGCLDRFAGHFSRFEIINGKGILYFGALNMFNKASMAAFCHEMPSHTLTLSVPFEGQIELINMDFTGSTETVNAKSLLR
jgi:hypothetical protein